MVIITTTERGACRNIVTQDYTLFVYQEYIKKLHYHNQYKHDTKEMYKNKTSKCSLGQ